MKKNHEESHKGKHKTEARIKIYCVLMGVISFLFCFAAGSLILRLLSVYGKRTERYGDVYSENHSKPCGDAA